MIQKRSDFPFIVLSPQCPKGEIWTDTDILICLLDDVITNHRVDWDRVYLTGMSLGGRGTGSLKFPVSRSHILHGGPAKHIDASEFSKEIFPLSLQ